MVNNQNMTNPDPFISPSVDELQQPPLDHLLDTLIVITNQLIQSSTIALSSTISSRKCFLSTYSTLESLIDRSIQTHQVELGLKLDSISRHEPILDSLIPYHHPHHLLVAWSAPTYRLDRTFLKSLLNKNCVPPPSKSTLIQTEKDPITNQIQPSHHQQQAPFVLSPQTKKISTTPLHSSSPDTESNQLTLNPSPSHQSIMQSSSPSTQPSFRANTLSNHSNLSLSSPQSESQIDQEVSKPASPADILHQSHRSDVTSTYASHLDPSPNSESAQHSVKPARIIKSSSSTSLSSPIQIQKKASTSLALTSTCTRIPLDPDPLSRASSLSTNLIQIDPPKPSSPLVQKLSGIDLGNHQEELLSAPSSSFECKTNKPTEIISNTTALLPPFSHQYEPYVSFDPSDSLKQLDLDFKLVHSSLNTP